jgi:hypothetical protein
MMRHAIKARLPRQVVIALIGLLPTSALAAGSTAHNGWQCTAYENSVEVHYWLTAPKTESGVKISDDVPTSSLTDSVFRYDAQPTEKYFYFTAQLDKAYRIMRDDAPVPVESIRIELWDGTKRLAGQPAGKFRALTLINAEAAPVAMAMANPETLALNVRLIDYQGKLLATYAVPVKGMQSAVQAAAAMMGKPGSSGIGQSCN